MSTEKRLELVLAVGGAVFASSFTSTSCKVQFAWCIGFNRVSELTLGKNMIWYAQEDFRTQNILPL